MNEEKKEPKFYPADTYSLGALPDNKEVKVLLKNGIMCKCHKVSAILVNGKIAGTLDKVYEQCNSLCSRFEIGVIKTSEQDEGVYVVRQTCETLGKQFALTNAVDPASLLPEKKKSNLLVN